MTEVGFKIYKAQAPANLYLVSEVGHKSHNDQTQVTANLQFGIRRSGIIPAPQLINSILLLVVSEVGYRISIRP